MIHAQRFPLSFPNRDSVYICGVRWCFCYRSSGPLYRIVPRKWTKSYET